MDGEERRRRLADARVGHLATVSAEGAPHIVPVVFAVVGSVAYTAVDAKPKSTRRLQRLANIEATRRASLLVDRYDEDWAALWWVRVDGSAEVLSARCAEGERGIDALAHKYEQYGEARPGGPVIALRITRWVGWSATVR